MNDEATFLQAILADPDNDDPRLIFADWLEERGDPRAELIRVQCVLGQLEPSAANYKATKAREMTLLDRHVAEWVAPLRHLGMEPIFRRGFPEGAIVPAEALIQQGEKLSEAAPLLRFFRVERAFPHVAELARCATLGHARRLDLSGNGLCDSQLRELMESPFLCWVEELNLSRNSLTDVGAWTLAHTCSLPRLQTLDLRDNEIGESGRSALNGSANFPQLRVIHFSANPTRTNLPPDQKSATLPSGMIVSDTTLETARTETIAPLEMEAAYEEEVFDLAPSPRRERRSNVAANLIVSFGLVFLFAFIATSVATRHDENMEIKVFAARLIAYAAIYFFAGVIAAVASGVSDPAETLSIFRAIVLILGTTAIVSAYHGASIPNPFQWESMLFPTGRSPQN